MNTAKSFIVLLMVFSVSYLFAQEATELPEPISEELPNVVSVLLGAVSAVIVEFVQKQKSRLASLGIAVGISATVGVISSFILGVTPGDLPLFIVQVFAYATTTWAVLFKGAGLNKLLKT